MTASFAASLCGYRETGAPSISDAGDPGSIAWGHALFARLGVEKHVPEVKGVGLKLEELTASQIAQAFPAFVVRRSQLIRSFEQYRHLGVFDRFRSSYDGSTTAIERAMLLLSSIEPQAAVEDARFVLAAALSQAQSDQDLAAELILMAPEESLLKLDITIATQSDRPKLIAGLSCKWSLRTDRAQDCLAQGAKLVANRRGRMPHYATLTMEPRPAMLRLLAYGSGSIDCVYHLALPELRDAAQDLMKQKGTKSSRQQRDSIERMVSQGRLRDYEALLTEIS
ncbi:NgoMIV family type II restriction endonuclease [Jatrophihabitans sp. YIM 134969]